MTFMIILSIFLFLLIVCLAFWLLMLHKNYAKILNRWSHTIDLTDSVIDFNKRLIEELKQNDHGE